MQSMNRIRGTPIGQGIFYIASRFLPEPFPRYSSVNKYISPIIRIHILQCTETCPLLSSVRTTLFVVSQPLDAPTSARPDSRCRDSDRYNIALVYSIIIRKFVSSANSHSGYSSVGKSRQTLSNRSQILAG